MEELKAWKRRQNQLTNNKVGQSTIRTQGRFGLNDFWNDNFTLFKVTSILHVS